MNSRVEVVLFDLGGTLFYEDAAAWPKVYKRAEQTLWRNLRQAGVRLSPRALYGKSTTLLEYYYALRGDGIEEPGTRRVLSDLLRRRNLAIEDGLVERALRAMYAVTQTNWRTETDAQPTLRKLLDLGYRLGAVSNGSDDMNAFEILDNAGMRGFFEIVITSAAHGRRKPDSSIFKAALGQFGRGRPAAMVGDNYVADIMGGHALGLRTIWITRRVVSPPAARPVMPDATVSTLSEVPAALG